MPLDASGLPERRFRQELETSQLESLSDEQLMEFIKQGCADAMTPLYRRHCRLLASIAYHIIHDREEAKDMVQEVFLHALRKIHLFDPVKGAAKLWLMSIAYRLSLNRRKYLIHRRFYDKQQLSWRNGNNGNGDEFRHNPDPLAVLTFEERTRMIRRAITRLPAKQRRAIELTCFDSLLMKEVAAQMQESPINACNHYYRGLRRLREIVDEMLVPQRGVALNPHAPAVNRRAVQSI